MVNVLRIHCIISASHNRIYLWLPSIRSVTCICSRNSTICTHLANWSNSLTICIVVNCIVNSIMGPKRPKKVQSIKHNHQRNLHHRQSRHSKNWHHPKTDTHCCAMNSKCILVLFFCCFLLSLIYFQFVNIKQREGRTKLLNWNTQQNHHYVYQQRMNFS